VDSGDGARALFRQSGRPWSQRNYETGDSSTELATFLHFRKNPQISLRYRSMKGKVNLNACSVDEALDVLRCSRSVPENAFRTDALTSTTFRP